MATPKPKPLTLDELAAQYGYAAAFFFSDAELRKLIEQAVREQWAPDKFRAKFYATNWYRTHSGDVRTWLELKGRDPAEAAKRITDQRFVIQQMASQMGIVIDNARLAKMAEDSLMFGWAEPMLRSMVGAEWRYQPAGGTGGQAATVETNLRRLANDYGVTIADSQLQDWIGGMLQGRYTQDHLEDFIRDQARSKYAGLSNYLDQGFTVRQVAEPYLQSYSQILETPYDTVSLGDPLVQRALQGVRDPNSKDLATSQTLYDFENQLRKDPRWLRTKGAQQSMMSTGLGVLQDMGLYA